MRADERRRVRVCWCPGCLNFAEATLIRDRTAQAASATPGGTRGGRGGIWAESVRRGKSHRGSHGILLYRDIGIQKIHADTR